MEILNYINGEWTKPNVTNYFDVIKPTTGLVIARPTRRQGGCRHCREPGERSVCFVAACAGQ